MCDNYSIQEPEPGASPQRRAVRHLGILPWEVISHFYCGRVTHLAKLGWEKIVLIVWLCLRLLLTVLMILYPSSCSTDLLKSWSDRYCMSFHSLRKSCGAMLFLEMASRAELYPCRSLNILLFSENLLCKQEVFMLFLRNKTHDGPTYHL